MPELTLSQVSGLRVGKEGAQQLLGGSEGCGGKEWPLLSLAALSLALSVPQLPDGGVAAPSSSAPCCDQVWPAKWLWGTVALSGGSSTRASC